MLLIAAAIALPAPPATADAEPFPDDWYYYGSGRPSQLKEMEGKRPPKLSVEKWVGDEQDLEKLKGKVVVVDFWGTWCRPCMVAVPKNIELVEKHKEDGLVFIGVHSTMQGSTMPQAVKKEGINYPVAVDIDNQSAKEWNIRFWPTYILIDREGIVRASGLMPDKVGEAVELLLNEKPPASEDGDEGDSKSSIDRS